VVLLVVVLMLLMLASMCLGVQLLLPLGGCSSLSHMGDAQAQQVLRGSTARHGVVQLLKDLAQGLLSTSDAVHTCGQHTCGQQHGCAVCMFACRSVICQVCARVLEECLVVSGMFRRVLQLFVALISQCTSGALDL
jgi:hypothetical protein